MCLNSSILRFGFQGLGGQSAYFLLYRLHTSLNFVFSSTCVAMFGLFSGSWDCRLLMPEGLSGVVAFSHLLLLPMLVSMLLSMG